MACRLVNLHKHPLRVDLRGGETLVLQPGQTSPTLYEELLYDNFHLTGWEKAGWIARLPARLRAAAPASKPAVAKPAEAKAHDHERSTDAARGLDSPAPNAHTNKPSREDAAAERPKSGARAENGAHAEDKPHRGPATKK
jgi:hypothetical protein